MRRWTSAYLIIAGLLLLAVPAGALIPDTVTIGTDTEWLTVGSGDTATITVQVKNSTTGSTQIGGAAVEFAVDETFGSISHATASTDATGMATAVFRPGTVAGDASITVTVSYRDGEAVSVWAETFLQRIDHAAPYQIENIWYEPEVTAGGTTEIAVRMVDRFGNPVDGRREAETVGFMVGSPSGAAALDGADVGVDAAGNATITLRVDTLPGENIVVVSPPEPLPDRYLTIRGVANGEPCAILVDVQPGGDLPGVIADGSSRFLLTYTLLDEYGNPSAGRALAIVTNVSGEEATLVTTNVYGRAQVSYGPRETTGGVAVTATAVDNTSVTCLQDLAFVSSDPVNLLLSTCPETMPSRDVPGSAPVVIRAKVVDQFGNPVEGENVGFSIQHVVVDDCFNQTTPPSLSGESATTDAHGIASVEFTPGAFTTERSALNYSPTATGTCKVVAAWKDIKRSIALTWVNYPYLAITTNVTPDVVTVNDTVDVTIRLKGDGWAIPRYAPIDVVILLDRGEGMLLNDEGDADDRMVYARAAAENFTWYIDTDIGRWQNNRVGLISYGDKPTCPPYTGNKVDILKLPESYNWAKDAGKDGNPSGDEGYVQEHYPGNGEIWYSDYADLRNDLVPGNSPAIHDSLWSVVPMKNGQTGEASAPLRYGLYKAIKTLEATPPSSEDSVRAIIVLMQSRYNYYGSPFGPDAGGSAVTDPADCGPDSTKYVPFDDLGGQQNLAKYAKSKGIQIFPIYYTGSGSQAQENVPRGLANESGGEYFFAGNHVMVEQAFEAIAKRLKTEAGVNTAMDVAFENVEVDSAPVPGNRIFDYVHEEGASTLIRSYNSTAEIVPPYTRDDTAAWRENQTLHFDIGTIRLNQTWEATFRLRVLAEGTIGLFGDGATITFNDHDRVPLPRVYITAFGEENTTMDARSLNVANLNCTSPAAEFLPLVWDLNYTGTEEALQEVSYSGDGGYTWIRFDTLTSPPGVSRMETTLDARALPPGEYAVRVYATAPDAPDAWDICRSITIGGERKDYILLE